MLPSQFTSDKPEVSWSFLQVIRGYLQSIESCQQQIVLDTALHQVSLRFITSGMLMLMEDCSTHEAVSRVAANGCWACQLVG